MAARRRLFDGGEHAIIGKFTHLDELRLLTLPNGVVIKFEQIIALAGDFYGLPEHPIIDPLKEEDLEQDTGRHQRFRDAYNTLARAPKDELQNELDKLLDTLKKECDAGKSTDSKTWDEITGGKWFGGLPVKQGRMLQLAENNHDHFLPYAKDAYLAGHQLAINKAREAGEYLKVQETGQYEEDEEHDWEDDDRHKEYLHEAFSLDAFACHFLTDSFASGHVR